jgi:lipopolysaccharide transport system permease protein
MTVAAPAAPLVIEAGAGRLSLGLRDLWSYRELLYFLIWRDVKVRYKQTVLGAAWAILQPLLAALVFTIFFGRLAGISSEGLPYPLFAYAGLLAWTFFAQGLSQSAASLVGSANLITKVYFPRLVIPLSSVLAGLVDLAVAFPVLGGFLLWYRHRPGAGLLLFPLFLLLALVTAAGVGTWLAALNVEYRDVRYVVPFLVQLWLFLTPVIYPSSAVVRQLERLGLPGWLAGVNPMAGVVEGFRWSLLGSPPLAPGLVGASVVVAALVAVTGVFYYRRVERSFADVV